MSCSFSLATFYNFCNAAGVNRKKLTTATAAVAVRRHDLTNKTGVTAQ